MQHIIGISKLLITMLILAILCIGIVALDKSLFGESKQLDNLLHYD